MEALIKAPNIIEEKYELKAINFESYKKLVADLANENRVTGPIQSEALLAYTKLNMFRVHRIEKTIQLLPEVKSVIEGIASSQTWLVITEGWCGDAAQIIPVLNAMAVLNNKITLLFLLRDENPELMDHYLTNGSSRSIPKLIVYDSLSKEEIFNWGPRPAELQRLFDELKEKGLAYDEVKEEVHRWYAHDRTNSIQKEIATLAGS